jgi:hypothetical protein
VLCSFVWLRRDRFRKGGLNKLGIDIIKKKTTVLCSSVGCAATVSEKVD